MNGVSSSYMCTASSKKDCRLWVLEPVKIRCNGCEIYEHSDRKKDSPCGRCPNYVARCKYDDCGVCTSSVAIVNRVVLDLKQVGLDVKIFGNSEVKG